MFLEFDIRLRHDDKIKKLSFFRYFQRQVESLQTMAKKLEEELSAGQRKEEALHATTKDLRESLAASKLEAWRLQVRCSRTWALYFFKTSTSIHYLKTAVFYSARCYTFQGDSIFAAVRLKSRLLFKCSAALTLVFRCNALTLSGFRYMKAQ